MLVASASVRVHVLVLSSAATAAGLLEVIIAVGGEDDKVVLRSVESYDVTTRQWRTLACLPYAVSKHGLVVSGKFNVSVRVQHVLRVHHVPMSAQPCTSACTRIPCV